jgi:hypothetical protein
MSKCSKQSFGRPDPFDVRLSVHPAVNNNGSSWRDHNGTVDPREHASTASKRSEQCCGRSAEEALVPLHVPVPHLPTVMHSPVMVMVVVVVVQASHPGRRTG